VYANTGCPKFGAVKILANSYTYINIYRREEEHRKAMCFKLTVRGVRVIIVAVEKQ